LHVGLPLLRVGEAFTIFDGAFVWPGRLRLRAMVLYIGVVIVNKLLFAALSDWVAAFVRGFLLLG
jgi:hypothetical protein